MALIAQPRIPAHSLELGRILELDPRTRVKLEIMIPLCEKAVPFLSVSDEVRDSFEEHVRNHPSVAAISTVSRHDGESLYSLDRNVARDVFFQGIVDLPGNV
ncbi:MAG: hypothetical protein V5A43_05840 [Haloarculaceae archaeon]